MHIALLGVQARAIDELYELGHTLTVLYTENNRASAEESASLLHSSGYVPAYDVPELALSVLLHLGIANSVDLVIPCHELAVVSAAILNHLLGLPGRVDPWTAMAGRDKAYQKSIWARRGVPAARYRAITNTPGSFNDVHTALLGLSPPFVVKPPALGGSRLVFSCSTAADVFDVLRENPGLRHAIVEERQPGDEWHFDGTVIDGRVEHFMVSRFLEPVIETKRGSTLRSVAYPAKRYPGLYAEAAVFAQAAVSALGGRWGVFHFEVFGDPGAFVAGELAWRPAGALASLSALHTIGVDLWAAHARILIGENVTAGVPSEDSVYGLVCLPIKPGARNGVLREDIEALPGVCHVRMVIQPGQVMGAMEASTTCVAMALIAASDVPFCEELIEDAVLRTHCLHNEKSVLGHAALVCSRQREGRK